MSAFLSSLTSRGRLFVSLGIALIITGTGLGMLDLTRIGVLLLVLPALTAFITHRHSLTFGVARRVIPARVQIDEPATVELSVINPSRTRSPVIAAEEILDYSLGDRPRIVIPSLRRGQSHTLRYEVRSHIRGRHRLGPLALSVSDPFGLTDRAVTMQSTQELVVLPRVVALGTSSTGAHGLGTEGTIPHMVALHGEDDISVRDYRDGDDLRRVHWPATARTGSLMVRQEDRPAMKRAIVLLDSRQSVHGASISPSLEWAVTMAASVVSHTERQGYAVHLITASPDPGIGEETTRTATSLEALALVTPGPDEDLSGVLHMAGTAIGAGGLIIAVVGACSDEDAKALASLRPPGSIGAALVVDRSTLADAVEDLPPSTPALHTAEALRRAGWHAVIVDRWLTFPTAWQRISVRRVAGAL